MVWVQLSGDARVYQRFIFQLERIEIARTLELRSCRFTIDAQRGSRVSKAERELTQLSQNSRARDKRIEILGILREARVQSSQLAQDLVGNRSIPSPDQISVDI